MILQALVQYYEDLLANGKITRPGWTSAKVSWALELDENGQLMVLHPLQQEEKRGKKTVLAPCQLQVPEQVKRSSGVAANFLCDNSAYMLGIDGKGKPERAMQCFAAAKELHLAILQNVPGQAAQAVRNFYKLGPQGGGAESSAGTKSQGTLQGWQSGISDSGKLCSGRSGNTGSLAAAV